MINDSHQGVIVFPRLISSSSKKCSVAHATPASFTKSETLGFDDEESSQSLPDTNRGVPRAIDAREVFVELTELLEDHAPLWYTDELRERALAALRTLRGH
jgi:hypothetical protein